MKILRTTTTVMRDSLGRVLTIRPDNYIEIDPNIFLVEVAVEAGQTFTLPFVSGYNYNCTINWDYVHNTIPLVENVVTWSDVRKTYTYENAGTYVIGVSGLMEAWSVNNNNAIRLLITRAISWGNVGLKRIDWYGCTAMTTLPEQESKLTLVTTFANFCRDCTSLISIPYGTFFGNTIATSFSYGFYNNTSLVSIHSTTFRDVINVTDFSYCFTYCNKLQTLPSKMFENCDKVTTWQYCFGHCTVLNNLPADTFYRASVDGTPEQYTAIANSNMSNCFYNCTSLTSIPSGFFSSPQVDNLGRNFIKGTNFSNTFYYCTALASLPDYMFHNQVYATSFVSCFYNCTSLIEVPTGCFQGCIIASTYGTGSSTSNTGTFRGCVNLTTVKPFAFHENHSVVQFNYTFHGCTSLVTLCDNMLDSMVVLNSITYAFYNTRISSWDSDPDSLKYQLSPDFFKYNVELTTVRSTFSNCINLIDLPETLFKENINISIFAGTFANCTGITSIPAKLFRYNAAALTFHTTFAGCVGITSLPIITELGLDYGIFYFNPQVISFYQTFYNCRLTTIPQITFWGNVAVSTNYNGNDTTGSFNGTFQNNIMLTSIPDEMFKNSINATDFSNTFAGCTNVALTYIPANLFLGNQNADLFMSTFNGVNLTSIPATLFVPCDRASNFQSCFQNTDITTIPSGLFDSPGSSIQNFQSTFTSCSLLQSIPVDLFKHNINVQTFMYCFQGDVALETLPNDLFRYNITATNFGYTFAGCALLENIPSNLFVYNIAATNFYSTFNGCNKLIQSPYIFYDDGQQATRFLNKSMTFRNCFSRTLYTSTTQGTAPDLWNCTFNFTPIITQCWSGAGNSNTSLTNYSSIPTDWKV